jgi:phage protein D
MEEFAVPSNDLMRPNYEVTLGSETFSRAQAPELVNVKVSRNVGLPTDYAEVSLIGSNYSFKKGDATKVKLGYDDNLAQTFSGQIENISHEVNRVRITSLGAGAKLLRLRFNRVYLSQPAGFIVKNIAQEAKVKVKTASDGISFPVYAVDDLMNGYEHILKLAERCNFEAYFTPNEELVFKEWGNPKSSPLKFGQEIIRLEAFDYLPLFTSTKVCGESPSSVKGLDTYHWLTKKEVKGEAGSGNVLFVQDPAIRDQKTAETVAKAKMEKLKYTFGIVVETVGKPTVNIGDNVTIEGATYTTLRGALEVRSIEHYFSKDKGFTSTITCWRRA